MTETLLKSVLRFRVDLRHCRALLRSGSKSFYAASLVLPYYYRAPATALYAFCRVADDEIDRTGAHPEALAALRARLARVYAGRPDDEPVDRALAQTVERFDIPHALPLALLEGFEWDVVGRRYETLSDLYAYAARVAGTVGAMMAMLMGERRPEVVARACDLGVAMQLTNIARDVGEDARAGRLYLPVAWLDDAGIDVEAWLAEPRFEAALGDIVARLLAEAERLYDRATCGILRLPLSCRPGMFAASTLYREIGREVERRGLDSVSQRAVVSHARKLRLLGATLPVSLRGVTAEAAPPLEETRFLVEAAAGA